MPQQPKRYRITKGNIRCWNAPDIITDEDLAKYPELGGAERLRDILGVIEDYYEDIPADEPVPPQAEAIPAEGDPSPNVRGHGKRGKS